MKDYPAGFTLIELLIVVAIATILIMVALPNFSDSIISNRVETQLKIFSDHLKFARSTAVMSQRNVIICHLDDKKNNAQCDNNWSGGWTVFYDDDGDGILEDAGADTLKTHQLLSGNTLAVGPNVESSYDFIRFNRSGAAYSQTIGNITDAGNAALIAKLCDKGNDDSYARAVIVEPAGAVIAARLNPNTFVYKDIIGNDLSCR